MDLLLAKKLVEEEIIDFDKLIKKTYKTLELSEKEAFLLMELNALKTKGINNINPSLITKKMSITFEEATTLLDSLMNKKFLDFKLEASSNGKQTECFDLDLTIKRIIDYYQDIIIKEMFMTEKNYNTVEDEVVELLERNFHKQLKPMEIELVIKWLSEYKYPIENIKSAILEAVRANKYSIGYLDGLLMKMQSNNQEKKTTKTNRKKSAVLKEFLES